MKYVRMNPKIKRKWIEALRSGEYKQCHEQLRTIDNKFCCLGVLCNLHAQEHPSFAKRQKDPQIYDKSLGFPSARVREWAGLALGVSEVLAKKNDSGTSFRKLADYIEKYV